jgi:hypothetical protein
MKTKTLILIIITLLVATPCFAGSGSVAITLSGTAGAGGSPASGSYDPTTHVAYYGDIFDQAWGTCTTTCYQLIDDGTRSPTTPSNDGIFLEEDCNPDDTCYYTSKTNTITGNITTARLYVYCASEGAATDKVRASISNNGSTWQTVWVSANCTGGWQSTDFTSLTYADTPIYIRFSSSYTVGSAHIWATYVTVNP